MKYPCVVLSVRTEGVFECFVLFEFQDLLLFNGYRYSLMDGFAFIDASEENKSWYEFSIELLHMMLLNMPDAIYKFPQMQMQYEVIEEIIYGLESGVLFGYYFFFYTYLLLVLIKEQGISCTLT